jgi:hypothetical protein
MSTSPRRTTDLGLLLVGAAILFAVVVGGIAAFLFLSNDSNAACGLQSVGSVTDRIRQVRESPAFLPNGKTCAYWLDEQGHDLIAYKAFQPGARCPLEWRGRHETYVICDEPVERSSLARYPTWHAYQSGIPIMLVDMRPQRCARYELGIARRIRERIVIDGATRVTVPGCGEFWVATDRTGEVRAIAGDRSDCRIDRDAKGRLTCDGKRIDPSRLPQHPVLDTGGDLVVDATRILRA